MQMITGMAPGVETIFANTNKTEILDFSYGLGLAFVEWLEMMAKLDDSCLPRVVSLRCVGAVLCCVCVCGCVSE